MVAASDYEDESTASKAAAAAVRRVRKGDRGSRCAESEEESTASKAAAAAVRRVSEGSQHLHMQDLRFSSLAVPSKAGTFESFADCTDFVPKDLPLHPDVLHHYFNGKAPFTEKRTLVKTQQVWASRSETIAGSQINSQGATDLSKWSDGGAHLLSEERTV